MPDKEFLEKYPLYRKFKVTDLPRFFNQLTVVAIKMPCQVCVSEQTFNMVNRYWENYDDHFKEVAGETIRLVYLCTNCKKFIRFFFIKIDDDKNWLMKIGQYPAWEIVPEKNIDKMLGKHAEFYKKGLICESQGYGIGAFAYYRRIVEEIIEQLLEDIKELIYGDDQERYTKALEETKKTIVTQEKIEIVQDLLPPILRPDGMNPLSILHSLLSEGLHAKSEDECMENAMSVREILVFLVNQVVDSKASSKDFTQKMRKLLEKKSKK